MSPVSSATELDEMRRERDRFRALVEVTSDWVWEVDARGRYTYCSPQCRALLGYEPGEMTGRTPFDFMAPEEAERVGRAFAAIAAERRPFAGLINVNRRKDGSEVVLETGGVPLLGPAGDLLGFRGVDRDVTERHRSHVALEALAAQLAEERDRARQANVAKSRFLALMGHELRTPLNAVIGFSDMIAGEVLGPLGDARYRRYAGDIRSSGAHLLAVINSILDQARIEAGRLTLHDRTVDLGALVEACLRIVAVRAEQAGLTVTAWVDPSIASVRADETRLKQILLNLLSNAVKFTPCGGRIGVTARLDSAGRLAVAVTDTGVGIAPEDQDRVFEPFVQVGSAADRPAEGSGLGLGLTRHLVEMHGGTLTLRSRPGTGTTMTVSLPPDRVTARRAA